MFSSVKFVLFATEVSYPPACEMSIASGAIFIGPGKGATVYQEDSAMRPLKEKKGIFNFFKTTVTHWLAEEPFQLAAALAYFTLFSLAPLLIVLTGIVGLLAGESTAQNYILGSLRGMIRAQSAPPLPELMQQP